MPLDGNTPMSERFEALNIDRFVHEHARLLILTALAAYRTADFMNVCATTDIERGTLSQQIYKLEAKGLVTIEKKFRGKNPVTVLRLTEHGRVAVRSYYKHLNRLSASVMKWTAKRIVEAPIREPIDV